MPPRILGRLSAAADLLRPATLFRTLARVDPLADKTRELSAAVDALRVQTEQLMTIQKVDWERRFDLARLNRWLDPARIEAHVNRVIAAAVLESDPFPYLVVENWLPDDVHTRVVDAMPASIFFAHDRDQHWNVPSGTAPLYSREVWSFVANTIVGEILYEALNRKFGRVIRDYVHAFCPAVPPDMDVTLHPSDGRIMLRRPGYNLMPHRDPKWGFVTAIVYLAREGDNEAHGTQLYRVRDDSQAPTSRVYYVEPGNCELVRDVPFRANSMLVFLNSEGAHGAAIPPSEPAALERYIYQFRLGPNSKAINRLISLMSPGEAAMWAGSKMSRAAGY